MAHVAENFIDQPAQVTLGSVVVLDGEYGVVWHVTRDTVRILPIRRGFTALPLSPAHEVAFHLPSSSPGWGIVCGELAAWPRAHCAVVGELDERWLLKVLLGRKPAAVPVPAASAGSRPEFAGRDGEAFDRNDHRVMASAA
jgi:hypothetical protein